MLTISLLSGLLAREKGRPRVEWLRRLARRVLFRRSAMNQIAFGTKRAFHGFLRVTRRLLTSYGLTAARFDLLYAVVGNTPRKTWPGRWAFQSQLRRRLGVTAPVVSRMLHSLDALGLTRRERPTYGGDQRQRIVTLTARGEAAMCAARHVLLRAVQRLVLIAICGGKHKDPEQRFQRMAAIDEYLIVLRRDFGDSAQLCYPWGHPDD